MEHITEEIQKVKEELLLQGYSPKTHKSYVYIIRTFLTQAGKSSLCLEEKDVRAYLLYLIEKKLIISKGVLKLLRELQSSLYFPNQKKKYIGMQVLLVK